MKVLISCDYSIAGEYILHEAHTFLNAFAGAEIHIFSVIDMAILSSGSLSNNTELMASLQADAAELGKKAASEFAGTNIHFSTELGYPAEAVLQKAKNMAADLLILGTHGRTGLQRIMMGSVAEAILRHAPCNTLVIPVKQKGHEQNTPKRKTETS